MRPYFCFWLLVAGMLLPLRAETLTQYLKEACLGGGGCRLVVDRRIALEMSGAEKVPMSVRVAFRGAGEWEISGGSLDFQGAEIEAAADKQVFTGSGRVLGLGKSRPEWFADASNGAYPAKALGMAYRATVAWGEVMLRDEVYLSPFFDPVGLDPCGGTTVLLDSPRVIVGSRRPVPDSETAPTKLVQGSVIAGEICGSSVVRLANLGVDEGPEVDERWFGGKENYGIQVVSVGKPGRVAGSALENVSVLTTGLESQHSVIFENQQDLTIRHLWLWTLGGTHGLVVKSLYTLVEDYHCAGAFSDCLIVKSDYVTDHEGNGAGSVLRDIDIHPLAANGDTGGVVIDSRWDSLSDLTFDGLRERGTKYGVVAADSLWHPLSGLKIANWQAQGVVGECLIVDGGKSVMVENFGCARAAEATGPDARLWGNGVMMRGGKFASVGKAATERYQVKPYLRMGWMMVQVRLRDEAEKFWAFVGMLLGVVAVVLGVRAKRRENGAV